MKSDPNFTPGIYHLYVILVSVFVFYAASQQSVSALSAAMAFTIPIFTYDAYKLKSVRSALHVVNFSTTTLSLLWSAILLIITLDLTRSKESQQNLPFRSEFIGGLAEFLSISLTISFLTKILVGLVVLLGGIYTFALHRYRDRDRRHIRKYGLDLDGIAVISAEKQELARTLNIRAVQMRKRASLMLTLMMMLITAGVLSIFIAGDLVIGDSGKAGKFERVRQIITELDSYHDSLNFSVRQLESNRTYTLDRAWELLGLPRQDSWPSISDMSKISSSSLVILQADYDEMEAEIDKIRRSISENRDLHASILRNLSDKMDSYFDEASVDVDVNLLIAAGVTRFGVLLVIIFLVQILLGVYRYSIRLASYYHARADALVLGGTSGAPVRFFGDFFPSGLGFGRSPNSPSDYVATILASIFGGWRKQESKDAGGSTP